jgi:very-short-patch-repair endonuclease
MLATTQLGVWTFLQAERRGANRALASRRVLSGQWTRKYPDVFVFPSWVSTLEGEALAGAWGLRDGLASRETAAYLQSVESARRGPVEITVGRGAHQPRPFRVREARWLPASDRSVAGKVPCTSLARTLVDLAELWPEARLSSAWDDALRTHRTSVGRLQDTALPLAGRGHPSTELLRLLLDQRDDGDPPPDSELERVLYEVVDTGGYGPVSRQMPLEALCGLPGRVDGYLPCVGLVLEADGRRWHTRVLDFERDHARNNEVQAEGIFVARFSYRMLMDDRAGVLRVLDKHFVRNGYVRSRAGLWVPGQASATA